MNSNAGRDTRVTRPPTTERLATIPRDDGRELRVEMATDQFGHRYLTLHVWMHRADGTVPLSRAGFTLRRAEVGPLMRALERAGEVFAVTRAERRWQRRTRPEGED